MSETPMNEERFYLSRSTTLNLGAMTKRSSYEVIDRTTNKARHRYRAKWKAERMCDFLNRRQEKHE